MLHLGFRFILTATIWGTLTGLLILAIKGLFSRRISAGAMFLMWLVFLLKLVLPVGPQSAFSLLNLLPVDRMARSGIMIQMEQVAPQAEAAQTAGIGHINLFTIAAAAWLAVALCLGAWFLLSSLILKHRLSTAKVCTQERMNLLLQDAKQKLGIRREIQLLIQPYIATPSLYGIFKPRILLPENMTGFSEEEMSYVFLHELSHYKRQDMMTNCLLTLLQLLHWFNPFIWFFFRKIREDMELATDEAAMKQLDTADYRSYGRTLLMAVERFSIYRITGSMMSMAHTKSNLKRRLKRICQFRRPTLAGSLFAVILVLVLGATCLTDAKQIPLLTIPQAGTSAASAEISEYLRKQPAPQPRSNPQTTTEDPADRSEPTPDSSMVTPAPTLSPDNETDIPQIQAKTETPGGQAEPQPTTAPPPETVTAPQRRPQSPEHIQSPEETAIPETEYASANRTLLTPGTNQKDILEQAARDGSLTGSFSYSEGQNRFSAPADSNGIMRLYLSADTIDTVYISILGAGEAEVASLSIVPRTYYAYVIFGLNPESEYQLDLEAESAGQLLIY